MKTLNRISVLIISFLATLLSHAYSQDVEFFSGKVTDAHYFGPLEEIRFTVFHEANNETMSFEIFRAQFNIQTVEQLIDQDVSIAFLRSVEPIAVGIRESSRLYDEISFFEDLSWDASGNNLYSFLGQFKETQSPNYQPVIIIEGSKGRVEEFALGDGVDPQRFYDGEYDGIEVIVTYVLYYEYTVAELKFGEIEIPEQEVESGEILTFSGSIVDLSDSGLGPLYNIIVENRATNKTMHGLVNRYSDLGERSDSDLIGVKVKLHYSYEEELRLSSIMLKSEVDKNNPNDPETIFTEGEFDDCQVGDVDGYLYIKVSEDEDMAFLTDFYCPDEIKKGDKVVVGYTVDKVLTIHRVEFL